MREFSFQAVLLGVLIGALLAAANAFVGLKVGMTISASIPAAVMALLILRTLLKRGTLLESNMVQTIGSAGESLAAGMIFTVPALFIMGQDPTYWEMVLWGGIGGLLGVCFMVPLRQVLIVREHGVLPYPEGVACAEVLEAGERGGEGAKPVIWGALLGGVFSLFPGLGFWSDTGRVAIHRFRTEFQLESSPALLGVGYILGARVSAYILSGALIAWFMLIPAIAFFGDPGQTPIDPVEDTTIAAMSPDDIWSGYIRYVGAGAVAIGGLISLFKSIPTIASSLGHMMSGVLRRGLGKRERTDRDIPVVLVLLGIIGLAYAIWRVEELQIGHTGAIVVVIATFFFVTVSSRLVGIVGSSSNPISGMTIATLLGAALVFKLLIIDRTPDITAEQINVLKITCIAVGAVVAIAIAMAGDMSQDLKTGFLVKATPWKQEMGKVVGVLTSIVAVAGVVLLLNKAYGFGPKTPEQPSALLAPQANIMKILVDGVLEGQVPWTLIMIGGAAAVIIEMLGLPALPVAVGMYLPLGLSTPIMAGGIVRWLVDRRKKSAEHDPGVLTASGLVAGQGLMGVFLAGVAVIVSWWTRESPMWTNPLSGDQEQIGPMHLVPWLWDSIAALPLKWGLADAWWTALPLFPFAALTIWLWWVARRRPPLSIPPGGAAPAGPITPVTPSVPPPEPRGPQEPARPTEVGRPPAGPTPTKPVPPPSPPDPPKPMTDDTGGFTPPSGTGASPKYRAGSALPPEDESKSEDALKPPAGTRGVDDPNRGE